MTEAPKTEGTTLFSPSIFSQLALLQAPRILGLCDREANSPTYGCSDRYYWHYRLLDLPNARFQETCWYFSLLYTYPFDLQYYQNPKLLAWIKAGITFWLKHRNSDGSVNEVYPFERSFCATSFSTLAVTESLLLIQDQIYKNELNTFVQALQKTEDWLSQSGNPEVANQEAACYAALCNLKQLYQVCHIPTEKIGSAIQSRKQTLLSLHTTQGQHTEGYFPEYGGLDVGYLSITLGLLALANERHPDSDLQEACQRGIALMTPLIQDDGRYAYQDMSRQTQYLYPYALASFSPDNLLKKLENGLQQNRVISPQWFDDRYCIALATDYLLTAKKLAQATQGGIPQC